jgi:hypothetical protein
MGRSRETLRDGRRSRKYAHVGKVAIFRRASSWCLYYRENGAGRRVRVGPDREEAERRAAEVNAELAYDLPSSCRFERIAVVREAAAGRPCGPLRTSAPGKITGACLRLTLPPGGATIQY